MGVGILAKRVVLELGSSTNFVYSLRGADSLLFYYKTHYPILYHSVFVISLAKYNNKKN